MEENVYHQLCESRCSLLTVLTLGLHLSPPKQLASRVRAAQTAIQQGALHRNEMEIATLSVSPRCFDFSMPL